MFHCLKFFLNALGKETNPIFRWHASERGTPFPTLHKDLQVDGYTDVEVTALSEITCIDTLIEYAVAASNLRICTRVLGNSEHVVGLTPYRETEQPAEVYRHLISKADVLELEVRTIFNPTIREAFVVHPRVAGGIGMHEACRSPDLRNANG